MRDARYVLNADFAPTAGAAKGSMESKRYFLHTSLNQSATFDYQHGAPDRDFFIPPHPSGATPPLRLGPLCYARTMRGCHLGGGAKPKSVRTQLRRDRLNPWVGLDHLGPRSVQGLCTMRELCADATWEGAQKTPLKQNTFSYQSVTFSHTPQAKHYF